MTAFHFACEYGYSEIAEMLMKKCNEFNIELNTRTKHGKTDFHHACKKGLLKCVMKLKHFYLYFLANC